MTKAKTIIYPENIMPLFYFDVVYDAHGSYYEVKEWCIFNGIYYTEFTWLLDLSRPYTDNLRYAGVAGLVIYNEEDFIGAKLMWTCYC